MSRSLSYIFPAGNTTDVCLLQTLTGSGNLNLNGNLANLVTRQVSFIQKGYSRQISLTSANNLSGAQFTVTGMQNGVTLTETITGPNNTTVYSTQVYDVISSVSVDGAVNAVSVGTGWKGFFPLIAINLERDVINYTLTLATNGSNNSMVIYGTIDNIANNSDTFLNMTLNNYNLFTAKSNTSTSQLVYSNYPGTSSTPNPVYSSFVIALGASAVSINVPIKLNFIQI